MPEDTPLSMDSAVSFLLADPEKVKTPAADATPDADAGADNKDAVSAEAAADATPDADGATDGADTQDTPADQGDTPEGDVDPGANALPPIEPPSSLSAEEKADWESLSRKGQEFIVRREQDNQRAIRNAQNGSAEQRKAVEAEVTRLKGLASQVEAVVNDKVQDLAREFPDVKTEADVVNLARTDPARYSVFQARLMELQGINQARDAAAKEVQQAAEKVNSEHVSQAKDALLSAFPTWKDPAVARKEATELQDYAIKMGVPEAAARNTIDPFVYKLAQKAMLYDRAQAAKNQAVTKTPPRVVTPGSQGSTPKADAKANNRRAMLDKLGKSGAIEDALGLMFE